MVTVVGARPQFIKAAAVSRAVGHAASEGVDLEELIVHSGQHFDTNMSQAFFDELEIPPPAYHLGVGGLPHGALTGRIMERLEGLLSQLRPKADVVLVYGDTDTTLAGALAAAKLHLPVAHVEAGLRSFNRRMPEETNRVVADHVSDILFCPTTQAVENLAREGIMSGVHLVGDVMYDVALWAERHALSHTSVLRTLGLTPKSFALVTVHREENTDQADRLAQVLDGLARVARHLPVVFVLHPRTKRALADRGWEGLLAGIRVLEPQPYFNMVVLESQAAVVFTDSGGVQKEAFFYGVPCVTLRAETEWVETVAAGWNRLVDVDPACMEDALAWAAELAVDGRPGFTERGPRDPTYSYGDGHAAERIVEILWTNFGKERAT